MQIESLKQTYDYFIASFSGGKDSYAMVLELIYRGYPLDEVVNYDTGMEFKGIYKACNRMKGLCKRLGIKYTTLYPKEPFLYTMFERPVKYRSAPGYHYGREWCGGRCRWGTFEKLKALDTYCEERNALCYIAIAADEKRPPPNKPYKVYPMIDWGMTEEQALYLCRQNGVKWEEEPGVDLYDILDRVSCWCCCNKNLKELEAMYKNLPEYWHRLKQLQSKIDRPFKSSGSIHELERRFSGAGRKRG